MNMLINFKELYMGLYAVVACWTPKYSNHQLCLFMDNTASTHIIDNANPCIKCLLSLIAIEAFYIPGTHNDLMYSISWFSADGQIGRFIALLHEVQWPIPVNNGYLLERQPYVAQCCNVYFISNIKVDRLAYELVREEAHSSWHLIGSLLGLYQSSGRIIKSIFKN